MCTSCTTGVQRLLIERKYVDLKKVLLQVVQSPCFLAGVFCIYNISLI